MTRPGFLPMQTTLAQLSEQLAARGFANDLAGDGELCLGAVNTLEDAGCGDISFLSNPKYEPLLKETRASAVIVNRHVAVPVSLSVLRCDDPYACLTVAIIIIHGDRQHPAWGVDAGATIDPSARIGREANIAGNVTIAAGATIGERATIYPGCYIGQDVQIGKQVVLYPNVVIYVGTQMGDRVTVHAGSVIGQDGLGYAPHSGQWIKIPQVGRIVIEDDVEIGANCAFDRATLGQTRVGRGTKFSNGVVVGHGARIGQHCMIVGQVGIAGSAVIGDRVTLAGQVGVSGHLTIGNDVKVGAQSGVASSLVANGEYMGSPAVPSPDFRRQVSVIHHLPELKKRVRELENQVLALGQRLAEQELKAKLGLPESC